MLDPEIFVIALIVIGIVAGLIFTTIEFVTKRLARRR